MSTYPRENDPLVEPVAPDFNDDDFPVRDPAAHEIARAQRNFELLVADVEMTMLVEAVEECYWTEGSQAGQRCRALTEEYFKRLNVWRAGIPPKGEDTSSVTRLRS
ncbi:hypothetical protein QOT17_021037 [Balamuthia mandrillaris]